jgi:F-type H+-transporting ATPase subunit b
MEGQELLGIDVGTLLLQIANFLIMAYVLTRFLFKPLKEMLDKRAHQATKTLDEAEEAAREAEALRREYEEKRENIDAEFAALKNEARIVIDQSRQQMLKEAYDEIEVMRTRAKGEIEQQRAEALRLHRGKIGELVATLIQRMMRDILNPEIHQAYLNAFVDQLRAVQLNGRVSADGEEAVTAELITAAPLVETERTRIAAALEATAARPVDLTYRADPDLVAGAMVRLGDVLIDGSLQGQIQQLRRRYEEEIE